MRREETGRAREEIAARVVALEPDELVLHAGLQIDHRGGLGDELVLEHALRDVLHGDRRVLDDVAAARIALAIGVAPVGAGRAEEVARAVVGPREVGRHERGAVAHLATDRALHVREGITQELPVGDAVVGAREQDDVLELRERVHRPGLTGDALVVEATDRVPHRRHAEGMTDQRDLAGRVLGHHRADEGLQHRDGPAVVDVAECVARRRVGIEVGERVDEVGPRVEGDHAMTLTHQRAGELFTSFRVDRQREASDAGDLRAREGGVAVLLEGRDARRVAVHQDHDGLGGVLGGLGVLLRRAGVARDGCWRARRHRRLVVGYEELHVHAVSVSRHAARVRREVVAVLARVVGLEVLVSTRPGHLRRVGVRERKHRADHPLARFDRGSAGHHAWIFHARVGARIEPGVGSPVDVAHVGTPVESAAVDAGVQTAIHLRSVIVPTTDDGESHGQPDPLALNLHDVLQRFCAAQHFSVVMQQCYAEDIPNLLCSATLPCTKVLLRRLPEHFRPSRPGGTVLSTGHRAQ